MRLIAETHDSDRAISQSDASIFLRGLQLIHEAEYWNRAWVMQEFVLPHKGILIQGEWWLDLDEFRQASDRLRLTSIRNDDHNTHMSARALHPTFLLGEYLWQMRPVSSSGRSSPPVFIENIPLARSRKQEFPRMITETDYYNLARYARLCSDIRDRLYSVLAFTPHGRSFRVDYHLNPFDLLLESLWLEHTSPPSRQWSLLHSVIKFLLLTPGAIITYSSFHKQSVVNTRQFILRGDPKELLALHLQSSSARPQQREWMARSEMERTVSRPRSDPDWCHTREGTASLLMPNTATGSMHHSFRQELQSPTMLQYEGSPMYFFVGMILHEWLDRNLVLRLLTCQPTPNCHAWGLYEATCTPRPMTVYYMLLEYPRSIPLTMSRTAVQ